MEKKRSHLSLSLSPSKSLTRRDETTRLWSRSKLSSTSKSCAEYGGGSPPWERVSTYIMRAQGRTIRTRDTHAQTLAARASQSAPTLSPIYAYSMRTMRVCVCIYICVCVCVRAHLCGDAWVTGGVWNTRAVTVCVHARWKPAGERDACLTH